MSYIKNPAGEWFGLSNIASLDSPALVIFPDRIRQNIELAKAMAGSVDKLRPHVKTNKIAEVSQLLLDAGIQKFKCATIAEAEMLAVIQAPDVLLAYQPVGPKINRLLNLVKAYPMVRFSCLTDNITQATAIAEKAAENGIVLNLFIDLNIGMNRTGILPQHAPALIKHIHTLKSVKLVGLHGYDGQIRDVDINERKIKADAGFAQVATLLAQLDEEEAASLQLVLGGTPTFPIHAARKNVECSPGTFVFSDWGYRQSLPDEAFDYAAVLISRVISIVDDRHICTDLGHKCVAAENEPGNRVHFLNAPDAVVKGQSEEHLVLEVPDAAAYGIGDVLYGVPVHICPTVALYERVFVAENGEVGESWNVIARNRYINF